MKFSVITINLNNLEGLTHTIESVLNQTCHDYEYIIIDGGSTDGSVELIRQHEKDIFYWVSEPDSGIYNAMNKGIRKACGEYCIFMNSGDEFYSDEVLAKVGKQELQHDVVCGDICFQGNNISPNPDKVTMRTFYKHSLYHQASCIRTTLLKERPYDESMRSAADWKWFMHALIFQNGSYLHLPITIATFEGNGFSEKQRSVGLKEINSELERCLPQRVLEDYEDYCFGTTPFRKMINHIELTPRLREIMFRLNVIVLKLLNVKLHSDWIKQL